MSTSSDLLEQYNAYAEDIGRIGERYESSKNFYVTVLSAFCGFLAMAAGEGSVLKVDWWLLWLVAFAGLAVCRMWIIHTRSVTLLFKVKFRLLAEMEAQGSLYPAFQTETNWLLYPGTRPKGLGNEPYEKITDCNITIAWVFIGLFLLIPLINTACSVFRWVICRSC